MAIKKRDYEQVTDTNIEKVIALLKAEKPITKKAACEILGITYNTSRLDTIIRTYQEKREYEREQRAKKRYTPPTEDEINLVVTSSLEGTPKSKIAAQLYRSEQFVTNILNKVQCPKRMPSHDYWHTELIPEAAIRDRFEVGERVWATRYNSMAIIKSEVPSQPGVYRIWLDAEEWQQFAYQPAYELASLEHLKQQGINI